MIAAIYLDSNIEEAKKFILKNIKDSVEFASHNVGLKDYKTVLQEKLQVAGDVKIIYTIIDDEYSREFLDEKLLLLSSDRNRSLSDTLHKLVANDFDIDKTAVALFQHPNTIRYRINKLKELMSVNSDLEFQVLASLYHNLPL